MEREQEIRSGRAREGHERRGQGKDGGGSWGVSVMIRVGARGGGTEMRIGRRERDRERGRGRDLVRERWVMG